MTVETLQAVGVVNTTDPIKMERLLELCTEYENKVAERLSHNPDPQSIVYDAVDLSLPHLLVQILGMVLPLLSGGFSVATLVALAKMLIPLLVKDVELQAILAQILELVIGFIGE